MSLQFLKHFTYLRRPKLCFVRSLLLQIDIFEKYLMLQLHQIRRKMESLLCLSLISPSLNNENHHKWLGTLEYSFYFNYQYWNKHKIFNLNFFIVVSIQYIFCIRNNFIVIFPKVYLIRRSRIAALTSLCWNLDTHNEKLNENHLTNELRYCNYMVIYIYIYIYDVIIDNYYCVQVMHLLSKEDRLYSSNTPKYKGVVGKYL